MVQAREAGDSRLEPVRCQRHAKPCERCRPLRGLYHECLSGSWGLRPRLYACARCRGLKPIC